MLPRTLAAAISFSLLQLIQLLASALVPATALAGGGAVELNHTCATVGGCVVGDGPGYPITLSASTSYVLTSNLVVPAGRNGVELPNNSALDLGGFEIAGPVSCPLGGCPGVGAGTGVVGGNQVSVSNGRVRGFARDGLELQLRGRIERLQIAECARHGISTGAGSHVGSNQIGDVGQSGILFVQALIGNVPSLYRDNTIGTTGAISVDGGRASGPNACFDQACGTSGKKFFYLTESGALGRDADAHCDTGFHMASLWEIVDPGEFEYDVARGGAPLADQSEGPRPGVGWIRTGSVASFGGSLIAGFNNCEGWVSTSGSVSGSTATLPSTWSGTAQPLSPWVVGLETCSVPTRVWCVQD